MSVVNLQQQRMKQVTQTKSNAMSKLQERVKQAQRERDNAPTLGR